MTRAANQARQWLFRHSVGSWREVGWRQVLLVGVRDVLTRVETDSWERNRALFGTLQELQV